MVGTLCKNSQALLHPVNNNIERLISDQQRGDGIVDTLMCVIWFQGYLSYIII